MFRVSFIDAYCKGCGYCVHFCPKKIITLADDVNSQGYNPATILEMEKCTGCAICARVCPEVVISIEKEVSP